MMSDNNELFLTIEQKIRLYMDEGMSEDHAAQSVADDLGLDKLPNPWRGMLRTGDRVTVMDHAAGKERPACVVRIINQRQYIIYVPRYEAEIAFNKATFKTDNERMEIVAKET